MTREQVMGIVRHALTFAGGVLLYMGLVEDEGMWQELSGGLMTVVGGVWSIVDKVQNS